MEFDRAGVERVEERIVSPNRRICLTGCAVTPALRDLTEHHSCEWRIKMNFAMKRHPEGTEKLIDTRDQRRKDREARLLNDPKIMQSIRRDQRPRSLKQIAVRMPEELFSQLKMQAIKEKVSIQKKMMDYISVGLQVDRDWDIDEPERYEKKPEMTVWDL
jgi:hypothetical protein